MICIECGESIGPETPAEVFGNTGHCGGCALELGEVLSCDQCGALTLPPTINIPGREALEYHLGSPFLCTECHELDKIDAAAELDYLRRHHGPEVG